MGDQDESELPDEIFGALRLKRKVGGTGYMYVTGPKRFSKKNPYQARVKNKRTGKTQNLGMYPSPHAAAIAVATVLGAWWWGRRTNGVAEEASQARCAMLCTHPCHA